MYFRCISTPGLLFKLFLILDLICQDLWDLLNHLVSWLLNLSVHVPEVKALVYSSTFRILFSLKILPIQELYPEI